MRYDYIDTTEEKNRISYNPTIEYNPERKTEGSVPIDILDIEDNIVQEDTYVEVEPEVETLESYIELDFMVQGIVNGLVDRLSPTFALGGYYSDLLGKENITLEEFKDSFSNLDDMKNVMIQDAVHDIAEDIEDGSVVLEVYEDVKEMERFLDTSYALYQSSILRQTSYANTSVSDWTKEGLEKLNDYFKQERTVYEKKVAEEDTAIEDYYKTLRHSFDKETVYKKEEEMNEKKRPVFIDKNKRLQNNEILKICSADLFSCREMFSEVTKALSVDVDKDSILTFIQKQKILDKTSDDVKKYYKSSLLLRYNKLNQEKETFRDELKNIGNPENHQRAKDELVELGVTKLEIESFCYDTLMNVESPSRDENIEFILNEFAMGVELTLQQYENVRNQYYQLSKLNEETRTRKLRKTAEKEKIRILYKEL